MAEMKMHVSKLMILVAGLLACLCTGSASDRADATLSPDAEARILTKTTHHLEFAGHKGHADRERPDPPGPKTAVFVLDKVKIGIGKAGLSELKRLIKKMPKGSVVNVVPYYGGGGFPFGGSGLADYAEGYGVEVTFPDL